VIALLARAWPLVERVGGRGPIFQQVLPVGSALVVTALGAAMAVSGALALAG
jgi:hypothetical protein